MNCFEISQLIIISIYTDAKEQSSISPIYDFIIAKLIFSREKEISKKGKDEHGGWNV